MVDSPAKFPMIGHPNKERIYDAFCKVRYSVIKGIVDAENPQKIQAHHQYGNNPPWETIRLPLAKNAGYIEVCFSFWGISEVRCLLGRTPKNSNTLSWTVSP